MSPVPERLESELLHAAGFTHGFFTRRGGVSPPPFGALNFAASTGDDPENVAANVRLAAEALGVPLERLYFPSQVHGVAHVRLGGTEAPREVLMTEADVTLSSAAGVACGVRSADCVPVLVADRASGAVAAVHSGWRGTVLDVVTAAVAALREAIGPGGDLVAAIGPHIETCCFEIGDDVAAELAGASSLGERAIRRGPGRPHADLRAIVRAQLEAVGVRSDAIDDVRGCTVCDAARFHSYRRDGARGGRLLSAIVSRGRAASASPG